MSTIQVDRIIPFSSSSVTVEGLNVPNLATTGSNTFVGNQNIVGTITASIAQGFALVGGVGNISTLVATSSFGGALPAGVVSGSSQLTSSYDLRYALSGSGGGGGVTIINPTLNPYSGSLVLVANTFTSASFAHISASANGQVNLVFKNNNNTADTIISGSNNLFVNPDAAIPGFKRYIGGSGNIMLAAGAIPQLSGSIGFSPTINNNYIAGALTVRLPTTITPGSTIALNTNNILGLVILGTPVQPGRLTSGYSLSTNTIPGTLSVNATGVDLTGSIQFSPQAASNYIAGGTTINNTNSAVFVSQNILNDSGVSITNTSFSSSLGLGRVTVANSIVGGASNTINFTGSVQAGTTNQGNISQNIVFGGSNILTSDLSTGRVSGVNAYHNIVRTAVIGNNLIVSGSSLSTDLSTLGSMFVGRYNAQDGSKSRSAETVFAIGTGNTTTRKTGFLIDSGSNSFIEGTLNVSGSSTFTGSVSLSSTLQLASLDPLPAGAEGQLANSGSNLFFFSGSAWNRIAFA